MTSVIAHEPDCPALSPCCAFDCGTNAYSGVSCDGERHVCEPPCRGEARLKELVEAAELILYDYAWLLTDKAEDRLDAALQPFREEVMPCETKHI